MTSSSKQLTSILPLVISGGAVLYALYHLAKKPKQRKENDYPSMVSHIHLKVENLTESKQFYLDLGFVLDSDSGNMVIMRLSKDESHPFLLLEESDQRRKRVGHAASAGYARMCLYVEDCQEEYSRLIAMGYRVVAPPITDRIGNPCEKQPYATIAAVFDPDGNMVELVSFTGALSLIAKAQRMAGMIHFPMWVHVNINSMSYENSWKAYKSLGFVMGIDYGEVRNQIYKALAIPDPGIAKQVSLVKFPNQEFCIDLIEWKDPKTDQPETSGSMHMAIRVKDIAFTVDELVLSGGWTLETPPIYMELPNRLKPIVGCTVKDPDGTRIDLVSYPETQLREKYLMQDSLQKKRIILVTGGDSGFGRSTAMQMAALGFKIIAACYTQKGADFLASIATAVVADLTTEQGLKDVVQTAHTEVNRGNTELWAIVNNAGTHVPGHVEWIPPNEYKRVMALNFHAPVYLIHELTPLLRKSRGRIINVSSVCGMLSAPSNSTYSCSKFALEALSDSLRAENKPFGVDVVVVQPTTCKTPLAMSWWDTWYQFYVSADPKKQVNHPPEWAELVKNTYSPELESLAEDPMIVVHEIMNALVMKDSPPPRILGGVGAKTYYDLSLQPESKRDGIFLSIGNELLLGTITNK